jgi:hypothetical protein
MDLVGSLVPAALAAKRDYSNFAAGETILAVSAPDDSAAGHSCGERCARLNHVMRELAAGLKQHAPQLVEENKLLLAVMDGEHSIYSTVADDEGCAPWACIVLICSLLPIADRRLRPFAKLEALQAAGTHCLLEYQTQQRSWGHQLTYDILLCISRVVAMKISTR